MLKNRRQTHIVHRQNHFFYFLHVLTTQVCMLPPYIYIYNPLPSVETPEQGAQGPSCQASLYMLYKNKDMCTQPQTKKPTACSVLDLHIVDAESGEPTGWQLALLH